MNETIDVEATPQSQALAIRPAQEVGLFGTSEPIAVIQKATGVADALKQVIIKQGLVSKISGKEYPRCEAWTLLGTMLGVFPVTVWTKEVEGGWEARVEARTKDGAIVGAAEAQCLKTEKNWCNRDDFALRSMAQTRATAKCLRMPLGFVMTLAGFEPTPAEEMTQERANFDRRGSAPPSRHPPSNKTAATPTPATPPAGKAPASPPVRPMKPAIYADNETRDRLIRGLESCRDLATEYFQKVDALLDTERLEDLPLRWVPVTKRQFEALQSAIAAFGNGEPALLAFKPNEEAPPPAPPKAPPPAPKPAPAPRQEEKSAATNVRSPERRDPEWFFVVVCPIPNKGQKRDDYLKHPDTILSLYTAMKAGDLDAQKRLWGFAKHWTPTEREFKGKIYPISEEDTLFREALDAFVEWESHHGKDTEQPRELPLEEEEDNVPF